MRSICSGRLANVLLCLAVLLGCAGSLSGQGIITGTITGTVVDSSGAVIGGSAINVVDLAKGTSFTTKSQGDGNFRFPALPVGTYSLTISNPGFTDLKIPSVLVNAGVDRGLGKQALTASGASTNVTVEAISPIQLDTTQSQVSMTFDSEQLESLPLNNGFDEVALLEPGVAQTHDLNYANTNGAGLSSNGTRDRSNNFELDGQSNNDNTISGPQIFFGNQDAIDQIQVIQTDFSAQYGHNTGTVVNYITKSGTNRFHGSAFDLYEGSFLTSYPNQDKSAVFGYCAPGQSAAATGCSPVAPLPRSVDNRWGGTLGGPILKDKLFFFGSTYFEHTNNGPSPFNSGSDVTPTPAGLTQLAGLFPGNAAVAVLQNYGPYGVPLGNPQPVTNSPYATTETVTTASGASVAIPVAPVTRTAPAGNYVDQEDLGRIDWQATPKDHFYLRYMYQTTENFNETITDAYGAGGDFYNIPGTTHSVGADITHVFSTAWLDQLRYSFQQSKVYFQGGSYPNCTVNSFTSCPGQLEFTGSDLGFGEYLAFPQGRTVKVTQIQDNASYTKGRNTSLFGGEVDIQNSPSAYLPLYNGEGQFADLNSFLQQNGTFYLATGNPVIPYTETDYALYYQDDFRVSSNLTLNMGLRWEFFGQAINELHNLTVKRESNPATAIWSTSLPLSARTTGLVNSAYKNFEPRIGFSYNPDFDRTMVVRAGFSIGFDPAFYNIFSNDSTVAPVATSASFQCNGTCLGNGNFSGAGLRATNLSSLPIGGNPADSDEAYVPPTFHNPYLETYYFGIEQQFGKSVLAQIRYVGTHNVGNFQSIDANPDLSVVQAAFPKAAPVTLCTTAGAPGTEANPITGAPTARPNCNLSNLNYVANTAFAIYNALQSQLTFHAFHGFSGDISYTFSHAIDNTSEIFSTGAGGNTVALSQNPLNSDVGERGTSGFSYPSVASIGMTYKVPDLRMGSSILRSAVDGFQVNAIYQYNSGQPFNPYQPLLQLYGLDGSYCDSAYNGSTVGPGIDSCRLVLSNKKAPLSSVALLQGGTSYDLSSLIQYIFGEIPSPATLPVSQAHWVVNNVDIANALGNPYPGSARNILRAQPFDNLDASIFKDFKLKEGITAEMQMSAYNALNHQYRGTPAANSFDDNEASPVNPFLSNLYNSSGSRNIQLGGKIRFLVMPEPGL